MDAPIIRPLHGLAEARACADFMAASEPWVTLGFAAGEILQRLTDPAREAYVATVDDQVVGALILFLAGPLNGYVQTIATHPDWRVRGLGTQIMCFAEQRIFRQSPNTFLCVSSFNTRAQKFYERLGYRRVGEFADYFVNGHSEILMRKTRGPLFGFVSEEKGRNV